MQKFDLYEIGNFITQKKKFLAMQMVLQISRLGKLRVDGDVWEHVEISNVLG